MAIEDIQAMFSDNQAVTATAFGSNFYDTGTIARNLGRAGLRCRFSLDAAAAAAGAATVTFQIVQADNSDGSGNTTVIASSGAIAKTALTLGAAPFDISIPDTSQRYVGVQYVVATGPLTAGNFTAAIVGEGGSGFQRNYPSGYPSPITG